MKISLIMCVSKILRVMFNKIKNNEKVLIEHKENCLIVNGKKV